MALRLHSFYKSWKWPGHWVETVFQFTIIQRPLNQWTQKDQSMPACLSKGETNAFINLLNIIMFYKSGSQAKISKQRCSLTFWLSCRDIHIVINSSSNSTHVSSLFWLSGFSTSVAVFGKAQHSQFKFLEILRTFKELLSIDSVVCITLGFLTMFCGNYDN